MSVIVSFENYVPPARFDDVPWESVRIYEGTASDGSFTVIDTITLTPPDADPSNPQERSFTTTGTGPNLWYYVDFVDASTAQSLPTMIVQNTGIAPYATTDQFFRIIKKTNPSQDQIEAAEGDLDTATLEINAEIDWASDHAPATADQLTLLRGVCLDRAADLWRHRESAPGILGVVDEGVPTAPGRYSFARYVARLAPLKDQWGMA